MIATANIVTPDGYTFTVQATALHHYETRSWDCPGEDWIEPIRLICLYVLLPNVEVELTDEEQIAAYLRAWDINIEDVSNWELDEDDWADAEGGRIDAAYEAYQEERYNSLN